MLNVSDSPIAEGIELLEPQLLMLGDQAPILRGYERLYPESLRILRLLGQAMATRSTEQIASHFQSSSQKTQLFVDQLVNLGLVRRDLNALTGASYALNEKGRHLLHEQGLL